MSDIIKLDGLDNLNKALKKLPRNVARKALRSAALAGGTVAVKKARSNIETKFSTRTGKLKKGVVRRLTGRTDDSVTVSIGPTEEAYYGRFLELGTKNISPKPWLRPALDEGQKEIIAKFATQLWKRIEIEAEKLKK